MRLSLLVVLYNCSISKSTTLKTILNSSLDKNIKLILYIWNNGPQLLDAVDIENYKQQAESKGIKVEIYQDTRNISLSKIYNFIIAKGNYDFFISLDQDSLLPDDFFQTIVDHKELDLILPMINNQGTIKFPYYVKQGPIVEEGKVEVNKVTSINSGMALSSRLIDYFQQESLSVFDERFAFYGVDTVFFLNLRDVYKKHFDIQCGCYGQIQHSLAMEEEQEQQGKMSYGRNLEYLYFYILYRLHYKNKSKLSILVQIANKMLKGQIKDRHSFKKIIACIFQGKHPRASIQIKQDL